MGFGPQMYISRSLKWRQNLGRSFRNWEILPDWKTRKLALKWNVFRRRVGIKKHCIFLFLPQRLCKGSKRCDANAASNKEKFLFHRLIQSKNTKRSVNNNLSASFEVS